MTKITLVLAQGPGKPEGDTTDRLVLHVTLTGQGQLDLSAFDATPDPWLASRERPDHPLLELEVTRLDEGWALQSTSSQDEPIWVFEGQLFRPGELVLLRRPDGDQMLYRIVAVE